MMLEKLRTTGRGDWLDDEMERIAEASNYETTPEDAWKRVRRLRAASPMCSAA
jgi:ribonuclease D